MFLINLSEEISSSILFTELVDIAFYQNIVSLEDLKGKDGAAWINLGEVDTSNYCKTMDEGTENEYEECGSYIYARYNFLDAEEGNYIFTDTDDYFVWHVSVEKSGITNYGNEYAQIEYWCTEENIKYNIKGYKDSEDSEWEVWSDSSYLTREDLRYTEDKISKLESSVKIINLGYFSSGSNTPYDTGSWKGYDWFKTKLVNYMPQNYSDLYNLSEIKFMFYDSMDATHYLVYFKPNYSSASQYGRFYFELTFYNLRNSETVIIPGYYWMSTKQLILENNEATKLEQERNYGLIQLDANCNTSDAEYNACILNTIKKYFDNSTVAGYRSIKQSNYTFQDSIKGIFRI